MIQQLKSNPVQKKHLEKGEHITAADKYCK